MSIFKKKKSTEQEEKTPSKIPPRKKTSQNKLSLTAFIIGIIAIVISILISATVMSFFEYSPEKLNLFAQISLGIGGLSSGIYIGISKREKGLLRGAKSGFLVVLPFVILSIFPFFNTMSEQSPNLLSYDNFQKIFTGVFCGACGGVIGVNK